jgi:hypothetical protein
MILEALVTTLDADGSMHLAPMGPHLDPADAGRFLLLPYPDSDTGRNLRRHPEGVLHVTDDVLLLARAALGPVEPPPPAFPAVHVRGFVLAGACRYHEFRVTAVDDAGPRVRLAAEVVHTGRLRDFFGFNRAKHAVLEAAILATRTAFLPAEEIAAEYRRLAVPVAKTGGPAEKEAFALLEAHVQKSKGSSQK